MKDIKTKPQTTTKTVKNAPKSVEHSAKTAVKNIKTVAKDTLVKNAIDKQLDIKHSEQPQRAEVEATEQVENTYYSAVDTVYQKGKHFAENKLKQHRQQVKTRQNQNADTLQNNDISEVKNTPKQPNNAPKTKESVQAEHKPSAHENAPKVQSKSTAQVKTKEAYIKSQKADMSEKATDTVKTKANYVKQHKTAEVKDGIKQKPTEIAPKTRENTAFSSAPTPKTKEQAIKDARKKYVSEKLKTKAEAEKSVSKNYAADIPKQNAEPVKSLSVDETAYSSNSMPKTKDNYIHSQGKSPADLIKTPNRSKVMPKQNTHTVTRNVSNNTKQAVKTKDSLLKGTSKAVKTGNSYIGKSAKKKTVKTAKRAAKTQKEITKKAAKQAAKQAKEVAQKSAQAAKATAKAAVKITVKVAQMVAAAAKAIVSALAALGGWAVLLVALIIVIVVAAIAASPFGIFISDEAADNDSIPISSIVAECNMELSNKLDDIENAAAADRSEIIGEQANWDLVLAVFATKVAGVEDDTVQDVVVITEDKKQKLKDVFWDMHEITSRIETVTNGDTSEKVVYITITTKTKDDMISKYNFTRKQQEALNTLLEQDEVLISATQSLAISDATAQDILKNLPESLSAERKKVIKAACSLVGKVNYFWGGKSSAIGWDSEWGKLKTVSAEGSKTTGTKRPFGLDCSGFVTWSFINSGFSANAIGHGTQGQIAKCSRISWSNAQAGDLAFYGDLSHVGIIAGKDASGNILVIHCSSSNNNVVITTNGGFGFAARPSAY